MPEQLALLPCNEEPVRFVRGTPWAHAFIFGDLSRRLNRFDEPKAEYETALWLMTNGVAQNNIRRWLAETSAAN